MQSPVQPEQRGMTGFILQQHVELRRVELWLQAIGNVLGQTASIRPLGQRDDLHVVTTAAQVLDKLTIVELAARNYLRAAIADETDTHKLTSSAV